MHPISFFLIVGLLFSVALYAAGYYVWSVPEQDSRGSAERAPARTARQRAQPQRRRRRELLRREHRGSFAFLGDLVDLGRRPAPPAGHASNRPI